MKLTLVGLLLLINVSAWAGTPIPYVTNSHFNSYSAARATEHSALGTAAFKNIPATGNASATEVVYGTDTRLTDSRNAADVSAWAKAATKPTYTYTEVGALAVGATAADSNKLNGQLASYYQSSLAYTSLTWTPVFSGLTVVGSMTAFGNYIKTGGTVCWWVQVVPDGVSTTASTVASTTFTLPLSLSGIPAPFSTSSNYAETYPNGVVYTGTTAYAPTWAPTNHTIYMNGCYQTTL